MSTETQKAPHLYEGLSRLAIVYLRTALNNPGWSTGIEDYLTGAAVLKSIPKVAVPADKVNDNDVLEWGSQKVATFTLPDEQRDAVRKCLKHAFAAKQLPINDHSVSLIPVFNLKS